MIKQGIGRQADCYANPRMILETLHEDLQFTITYTTSVGEKYITYRINVDDQLDASIIPKIGTHVHVKTSKWDDNAWPIPFQHSQQPTNPGANHGLQVF